MNRHGSLMRWRRLVSTVALACLVALVGLAGLDPVSGSTRSERDPGPVASRDRVADLLQRYDCWSNDAPAGAPTPSRAVVTLADRRPRVVSSSVGFGIWLDGDPGVLHGFCP